ncbi:MAG: DNA-binding response regulator, partial [Alphaproteobacteria bacterium]|nr:DNA-binding response regulator [Alphaproteobacteria bacterium]
ADSFYSFDGWRLAIGQRELKDPGVVVIPLSTAEFHLLQAFVTRPKMVLNRDQLLDIAYSRQADVFDRTIDNQVSRLRRKIEKDPKNPRLIKTVWGGGYTFSADVTRT